MFKNIYIKNKGVLLSQIQRNSATKTILGTHLWYSCVFQVNIPRVNSHQQTLLQAMLLIIHGEVMLNQGCLYFLTTLYSSPLPFLIISMFYPKFQVPFPTLHPNIINILRQKIQLPLYLFITLYSPCSLHIPFPSSQLDILSQKVQINSSLPPRELEVWDIAKLIFPNIIMVYKYKYGKCNLFFSFFFRFKIYINCMLSIFLD